MEILKKCAQYNDINFENSDFIKFIENSIIKYNITNKRRLSKFITNLIYEKTNTKRKTISYSYYESLGWNNRFDIFKNHYKFKSFEDFLLNNINRKINIKNKEYINNKLELILNLEDSFNIKTIKSLFIFNNTSIFTKEHWIELGYNSNESVKIVKKIQSNLAKKRISKYSKEELSEQSVWSKKYWKKKGQINNYKKYNKMCREHYTSDREYRDMLQVHSEIIKKNIKRGLYDNFLKPNKISKKEQEFFDYLKEYLNVKHMQYIINCRNKKTGSLYFADGYIKILDSIILIEFDGMYWHNNEYDKNRDNNILETRGDIIGILRISDKFFKKHKDRLIKKINNGIEEIKNKKNKVIRIY